jgi:SAM-dependent methyltransferase
MNRRWDVLSPEAIRAHDRQRVMPAEAQRELLTALVAMIGTDGPCLDAGAGTGNIAIPLHDAGVPVVAADISWGMLRELHRRQPPGQGFPLVRADIMALPFRDATFGSVHVAHTMHLVEDWERALAEVVRVTIPGGALLFALGFDPNAHPEVIEIGRVFSGFLPQERDDTEHTVNPEQEVNVFTGLLESLGAAQVPGITITYTNATSPRQEIDRLQHNVFSRSAWVDQDVLLHAAHRTCAWAARHFNGLDTTIERTRPLTYHVFRKT